MADSNRNRKPIPLERLNDQWRAKFWASVERLVGACWEWRGTVDAKGYGICWVPGGRGTARGFRPHRVAYVLERGPFSYELDLDHLCRNRRCVNPEHLEPVTNAVNVSRGLAPTAINARKASCQCGSGFVRRPNGGRRCPRCHLRWTKTPKESRVLGLCVRCHRPSETYRCAKCRERHNALDRERKR
jgi:hypothetical protein